MVTPDSSNACHPAWKLPPLFTKLGPHLYNERALGVKPRVIGAGVGRRVVSDPNTVGNLRLRCGDNDRL